MEQQMEMDLTLDSQRSTIDNTQKLISMVYEVFHEEMPEVQNKHEAYGITSEQFQVLKSYENQVKAEMDTFLKVLPSSETDTIQVCSSIYAAAQKTAVAAIELAAKCQCIMKDLYYDQPTPIEQAIKEADDGFEEADEVVDIDDLAPDPKPEEETEN